MWVHCRLQEASLTARWVLVPTMPILVVIRLVFGDNDTGIKQNDGIPDDKVYVFPPAHRSCHPGECRFWEPFAHRAMPNDDHDQRSNNSALNAQFHFRVTEIDQRLLI